MRVTEPILAVVVIALAAFVATQSTVYIANVEGAASGTIVAAAVVEPLANEVPEGSPLTAGQARGRLAPQTEYVLDVPRDAALSATDMRRRIATGASGTYIDQLLLARDSVLTRWPNRLITPLRVWVGDGGMHEGWDTAFPALVRDAFEEWSQSGVPIRFTYVRDSATADVRVRFVPAFAEGISGRTIWSRDSAWWLVGGNIELALTHAGGAAVSREQMHAIALHEVGHLLGLDHVDDPSHIMAPRVRVRALSDADRATVRLLYSVPAGSLRQASGSTGSTGSLGYTK